MTPKLLKNMTSKYNILYVEDDETLRNATQKLFEQFFREVDTASNGKEGLNLFDTKNYDLIISDINMPILNGVDMIKEIKSEKPEQLVLVTSAHSESDQLLELIDAGVDKFILKPLDLNKLLQAFVNLSLLLESNAQLEACEKRIKDLEEQLATIQNDSLSKSGETHKKGLLAKEKKLLSLYEKKLHTTIYDIQMEADFNDLHKEALLTTLDNYATLLKKEASYEEIALNLNKLDQSIENGEELFAQKIVEVTQMLEAVVNNLTVWRKSGASSEATTILSKSMKRIMAFLRP